MTSVVTGRRFGVNSGKAVKVPCKVATTANVTLSGEQTIDGVACVADDRVLVRSQTNSVENGIYYVDTGAWQRTPDFDDFNDITEGTLVPVNQGTAFSQKMFRVTTSGTITPGTTSLALALATYSNPNDTVGTVSNITALRAVDVSVLSDNAAISILGYYSASDGGGGSFYWDSASTDADDGGLTILPSGHVGAGRWKRAVNDTVSVKYFGAVGDGVTDDTTAIQSAIDSSQSRFSLIFFPAGDYVFSTVTTTHSGSCSFSGEGASSILRGTIRLIGISVSTDGSVYKSSISGLWFIGNNKATSVGISASYTWQTTISHCHFENMNHAIEITSSIRDHITDNYFNECYSCVYQVDTTRSADLTYSRNQSVSGIRKALHLKRIDGLNVTDNVFFGAPLLPTENHVYIEGTGSHSNWIRVIGNTFFECGSGAGVNNPEWGAVSIGYGTGTISETIIANNVFGWNFQPIRINSDTAAVAPANTGGIIITNNFIEQYFDNRGECHSVFVSNINRAMVSGNHIHKTGGNAANTYDAIRFESVVQPSAVNNFSLNEGVTTSRYGVAFVTCTSPLCFGNNIIGAATAAVLGAIPFATNSTYATPKLGGLPAAVAAFDGVAAQFAGNYNIQSVVRNSIGYFTVTYLNQIGAGNAVTVSAAGADCRVVGSPSNLSVDVETLNSTGSRVDPTYASVVAW